MITVYTGNGKGKTTTAIGESLATLSQGKKVLMVQFLKGSTYSGELLGLYSLGVPFIQFGVGCRWSAMIRTGLRHCNNCGECFRLNRDPQIAPELIQLALHYLHEVLTTKDYQMIIMDEVSHALNHQFLSVNDLKELITNNPIDWILTGRKMPEELMPLADCWWELRMVKHPMTKGIASRRGIEY